jgi:hypothetical protein
MHEFEAGKLRSGKRGPGKGPVVKSRAQAIAIGLSEDRAAGKDVPPPPSAMGQAVRRRLKAKGAE